MSAIHPTSAPPADFPFPVEPDDVDDWSYALGPGIYVVPIVDANVTSVNVTLPDITRSTELARRWGGTAPSAAVGWVDYWNTSATYPAGATVRYTAPLPRSGASALPNPVFIRQGTLMPLHISTPLGAVPQGHEAWAPALTLLLVGLDVGASASLPFANGVTPLQLNATITRLTDALTRFVCAPFTRPIVLLWRNPEFPLGRGVSATVSRFGRDGNSFQLQERDAEPLREGETPLALTYESTSRAGGQYPVDGVSSKLWARYHAELAGSFSLSSHERVMYLGADDVANGTIIDISI